MTGQRTLQLLRTTLWSLLSFTVLFCILSAFKSLINPYPDDYVNGIIVNYANLLLNKGCYFLPINSYPFVHAAYPPVFITLTAICFKLFGSSFFIIRALSIVSTILMSIALYICIQKATANKMLAVFSALIFLTPSFMYDWISAGRVDTLAILFSLLGLYLYFSDNKKIFWPIALFTLAFYTKHSVIAAAGAVFLDQLLIRKDFRRSLTFAAMLSGAILSILAVGSLLTQGQFFLHLFTYTKVAGIELQVALTKYIRFFRQSNMFYLPKLWTLKHINNNFIM